MVFQGGYALCAHPPFGLGIRDVAFTRRRSPVRIRPSPLFFCGSDTLEPSIEPLLVGQRVNDDL